MGLGRAGIAYLSSLPWFIVPVCKQEKCYGAFCKFADGDLMVLFTSVWLVVDSIRIHTFISLLV